MINSRSLADFKEKRHDSFDVDLIINNAQSSLIRSALSPENLLHIWKKI